MTQVGEGHEAAESAPPVLTVGAPTVGEILAERYQLEEHINDDSAGRQVWRGIDVVLRRPVAVVLRYPGGDSAAEMLQAAVAASRVVHPNLVGVYDAIDEQTRAYVVREWVEGSSLRELVAEEPLDPVRATSVTHAVASAVASVHATDMVHGNVHPGTVLVAADGRVVLADARADGEITPEADTRAIGGVLYFALTGYWPHAEAGRSSLPDAVRDGGGALAAPRQMRAGVPTYLDDLAMDLLDHKLAPPATDVLAAELARLDSPPDEHFYEDTGPLRFGAEPAEPAPPVRSAGRKIAAGVAGLLVLGVVGLLFGINALAGDHPTPGASPPVAQGTADPDGGDEGAPPAPKPRPIKINSGQVRVIDPNGARDELDGVAQVVDGDPETGWKTDHYTTAKFGNLKPGMGILINLGSPRPISSVKVQFSAAGAHSQIRWGTSDQPSTASGDRQLLRSFKELAPVTVAGATHAFGDFDPDQRYQYLLVWVTEMPDDNGRGYHIGIQEITVEGPDA